MNKLGVTTEDYQIDNGVPLNPLNHFLNSNNVRTPPPNYTGYIYSTNHFDSYFEYDVSCSYRNIIITPMITIMTIMT